MYFRLAIVITDGASRYPEETKKEAEALREMGVSLLAVGIKVKHFVIR